MYTDEAADSQWQEYFRDKSVRCKSEEGVVKLAVVGHTTEVHESGQQTRRRCARSQVLSHPLRRQCMRPSMHRTNWRESAASLRARQQVWATT